VATILYFLLPYVEQNNLYVLGTGAGNPTLAGSYTFCSDGGAGNAVNGIILRSQIIPLYICPSDPSEPGLLDTNTSSSAPLAHANYRANVMVFDPNGPGTITSSMPDGTSNTVAFAHGYQRCDGSLANYGGHTWLDWAATMFDIGSFGSMPGFGYKDYFAFNGVNNSLPFNPTNGGNDTQRPNFTSCQGIPFTIQPSSIAAGSGTCDVTATVSPHSVMIVSLGDGSVRSVSASISATTWKIACNPKDGNPLGNDWQE
jgi:hypothetical protein